MRVDAKSVAFVVLVVVGLLALAYVDVLLPILAQDELIVFGPFKGTCQFLDSWTTNTSKKKKTQKKKPPITSNLSCDMIRL
jgi:hypothetical protein